MDPRADALLYVTQLGYSYTLQLAFLGAAMSCLEAAMSCLKATMVCIGVALSCLGAEHCIKTLMLRAPYGCGAIPALCH